MAALNELLASIPLPVQLAFGGIGLLAVASKVLSYVRLLLSLFVLSGTNLRKYGKKGSWAVVTGASDGLGKEFAWGLAAKGFNLVLVSRTQSKLDALAAEIEAKYGDVKTKVLAMDYARDSDADYAKLAALIEGLDIAILINNVGQSHSIPVAFTETDGTELRDIITINCLGTLKTTRLIAPGMQKRRRGLILTMGSFGGWTPTPYLATYSGSKAFLQQWSTALAAELRPHNVDVQLVLSYLVTTAMSKVRRTSMLIPNPRQFVRATLSSVNLGGWQASAATMTPYWSHALLQWWVENLLGAANSFVVWYNMRMHIDIRRRALRKAEREAKKA